MEALFEQWWNFLTANGFGFLKALCVTVRICLVAIICGMATGLIMELVRQHVVWLRIPLRCAIEVIRGTPLLVQLFLLYYAAPEIGLLIDAEPAGMIGMSIYAGAYFAEIFRAGFASIPKGQIEAASSLGLSPGRILWRIQLPQMACLIIPPSVNQIITLVKDSAMLSIITVPELTKHATKVMNETFEIAEPLCILALLYWILSELVTCFGRRIEKGLTRHLVH